MALLRMYNHLNFQIIILKSYLFPILGVYKVKKKFFLIYKKRKRNVKSYLFNLFRFIHY